MIARLYRPLVMGLLPTALIACMNPVPMAAEQDALVPLGVDLGGAGPVAAPAQPRPVRAMHAGEDHASRPQYTREIQLGGFDLALTGFVELELGDLAI